MYEDPRDQDQLSEAKGVAYGMMIGIVLWIVILFIVGINA